MEKNKKLRGIDQEFEDILKSLKRQALHVIRLICASKDKSGCFLYLRIARGFK